MKKTEHRSFDEADEVRDFTHGRAEILNVGGGEIGRLVLQPGWRWSNDVKPIAKTESCEAPHFQYHVSGRIAIRMDDGTEFIAEPGDVTSLPSGHDAWVVGEEPVVVVDCGRASEAINIVSRKSKRPFFMQFSCGFMQKRKGAFHCPLCIVRN